MTAADFWSLLGLSAANGRIGEYAIERELGRGSAGVVYAGRDRHSGRKVAIKAIRLAQDDGGMAMPHAKAKFLHEARVLIWLDHPDIVTIYDVGEENGIAYTVMEFLEGRTLEEFTSPARLLPLRDMLSIMARVAEALGYAHEQHIHHCDIKPANIVYCAASNSVKVTDFDISRHAHQLVAHGGKVVGSAPYMSPEQVLGGELNGRADLFSLGATLYQLACGHLPFEADTADEIMRKIVGAPHRDIMEFRPDLPPCVRTVIDRALAKRAEQRFRDGYLMADALRQCAKSL